MDRIQEIKDLATTYGDQLIEMRHFLHAHPELSYHEEKTSAFICERLRQQGISFTNNVGGYGIIVDLKCSDERAETIVLRGDMDALPIQELNDVPYRSTVPGVMHACGHDVHTTCLYGALLILHALKDKLTYHYRFLFQPAEEKFPGGASLMIKDGAINGENMKGIIGQHVHPELEVGKVGFKSGPMMASADELYITVHGKGGHAALPHLTIDPIHVSAMIINGLQSIVSRNQNPIDHSVLTIGKINSVGGATNVIPEQVKMEGTFRTMNEVWRKEAHERIETIAQQIAESMGASCDVHIKVGYPHLKNDPSITENARELAIKYLGPDNVEELPIRMTAEDFSYYSQHMPACFYRLGVANTEKGITSPVHTPTFDIDEESIVIGSGLMAYIASEFSY